MTNKTLCALVGGCLLLVPACDTTPIAGEEETPGPTPDVVMFQIERLPDLRGATIQEAKVALRTMAVRNGYVVEVTLDGGRSWTPHRLRETAWTVAPNGNIGFVSGLTEAPAAIASNNEGTVVMTPATYQQTLVYSGGGETYEGGTVIGTIQPRNISIDAFGGFHIKGHQAPPGKYRYFRGNSQGRGWATKDALSDFGVHYVNPFAPDMVFEATIDNSTGQFSVHQSLDSGMTFSLLREGDNVIALSETRILVQDRGWYLSDDSGASWRLVPGTDLPVVAPGPSEVLSQHYSLTRERSLHRVRLDSGEQTPVGPPPSIRTINVLSDGLWVIEAADGVYLRSGAGATEPERHTRRGNDFVWSPTGQIAHLFDHDSLCRFRSVSLHDRQVLVACHDGGTHRSEDNGETWAATGDANAYVSYVTDSVAYAIDSLGDLYSSADGGRSWLPGGSTGGSDLKEPVAGDAEGNLLVATFGERVLRSHDFGQTWFEGDNGVPGGTFIRAGGEDHLSSSIAGLEIDPVTGMSYLGTLGSGLFWSTDFGASWSLVSSGPSGVRTMDLEADGTLIVVDWANRFWRVTATGPPSLIRPT